MSLPHDLEERLTRIGELASGWDDDEAEPVPPMVVRIARVALSTLLARPNPLPVPDIGAVENGRLDLYWREPHVFLTVAEDQVRLQAVPGRKLRDTELEGDDAESRAAALVAIIDQELSRSVSTSTSEISADASGNRA